MCELPRLDWFHYNAPRDRSAGDDAGWGCVYRAAQNAALAVGARVPSMATMIARLGGYGALRQRHAQLWIEPAQAARALEALAPEIRARPFVVGPRGRHWFQTTEPSDYETFTPAMVVDAMRRSNRWAIVVDDGIMGTTWVPCGNTVVEIDPHVRSQDALHMRLHVMDGPSLRARLDVGLMGAFVTLRDLPLP